jgi:hypothetical protein
VCVCVAVCEGVAFCSIDEGKPLVHECVFLPWQWCVIAFY